MYVEINDPVDCTIITYAGDSSEPPPTGKSRKCRQCGHQTWALTSSCRHCGYDRWTPAKRIAGISSLIAMGLFIAQLKLLH